MADKKLNLIFAGVDQLTPMLQKGQISADQFNRKLKELNQTAQQSQQSGQKGTGGSYHDWLADTNAELGKRSDFAKTMKLLAGGGVIGGFGMAANEVAKVTEAMVGLKNGTKQWSDVLAEVPIFGQGYKIGANIRELLTGEKAVTEEAKKQAEWAKENLTHTKSLIAALGEMLYQQERHGGKLKEQEARLFGGEDAAKRVALRQDHDDEIHRINKESDAKIDALAKEKEAKLKAYADFMTVDDPLKGADLYEDYKRKQNAYDAKVSAIEQTRSKLLSGEDAQYKDALGLEDRAKRLGEIKEGVKDVAAMAKTVGDGVSGYFSSLWAGAEKHAKAQGDALAKLREEAATTGMDWKQKALYDLKSGGYSADVVKQGEAYINQIDAARGGNLQKSLAALQQGTNLTGVAQASMERDNIQQRKIKLAEDALRQQQQTADNTKRAADGIGQLLTAVHAGAAIFGL